MEFRADAAATGGFRSAFIDLMADKA